MSGRGFEVIDPAGAVRVPTAIETADHTVYRLIFDPILGVGEHGLRREVRAADAYPIFGGFRFTVAPALTPAPSPASTTPPGR